MSEFFIHRPKFAWVVALFIMLAGILALPKLPVAQFPVVAPPQIGIIATYPGASASVVTDSVTSIIEEELNGAKHMLYYDSSSSSNGMAEIYVTFEPGTDPDLAQIDLQNRLKKAEARLPQEVRDQGVQVEQAGSNFLMFYALKYKEGFDNSDVLRLSDYTARYINNEIRRLPGVGRVQFFGAEAAMRIWLDPQKLIGYGLSIDDVNAALEEQNVRVPAGSFGSKPGSNEQELTATIEVNSSLNTPEEFASIILLAKQDGAIVTLGDVARIDLGQQSYDFDVRLNGQPVAASAVQLSSGANAIATSRAVRERLQELAQDLPDDLEYEVPYDTSLFVDVAIKKVIHTLLEAIVLVFLVMLLFLQNLRYTLIPTIVVPVCLLGTFAAMWALGFSVNMMTMFGMVLAIGILVDDAIVVVENVERIMHEEGLPPVAATLKAMQQVSGAIIGITLVLTAVFLPLAFMSGSVGVIYKQFSLSLAVSILFSGFMALTLTPALCATLLKPIQHNASPGKIARYFSRFNHLFERLTHRYSHATAHVTRKSGRYMLCYALLVAALAWLMLRLPASFVPEEDQGFMLVDVQLPPGAPHSRTVTTVNAMEAFLLQQPGIDRVTTVLGFSFAGMGQNAAIAFPTFKHWDQRTAADLSVAATAEATNNHFEFYPDGTVFALPPPPVEGLGNSGGFSMRLQDRGALGRPALLAARDQLLALMDTSPIIQDVYVEGLPEAPQLFVDIDRAKAGALGVNFADIRQAISTSYGSATINDFPNQGRMQRVIVQSDVLARNSPEGLLALRVPNNRSELVPLSSLITVSWQAKPVQLSRYNGYPAFKISGGAAPGYSTSEAMQEVDRLMGQLPRGIGHQWTAMSYQERFAGAQAPLLFALSILVVFLVLVALYESWSIPAAVMLAVPVGSLGAVAAVTALGLPNDVYFKVGLITVIGLAAKNAILIVEFAKDEFAKGISARQAAMTAARLRFRPIVMTSLAFMLGVVPLAVATGAGAASQRAIGTGVLGGMFSATVIGVLLIPVFYVWVMQWVHRDPKPTKAPTNT